MQTSVSARGYTSVLLVLNMKRYVVERDQERFQLARGSEDFAQALRVDWLRRSERQNLFVPLEKYRKLSAEEAFKPEDSMSTEEIGFATGVFRSLMLERFVFPSYRVDTSRLAFPHDLETNFQFKKLFREILNQWEIYIRPSATGFFIIRLTQKYDTSPRTFLNIAKDILRLQESLDVPSAQRRLEFNRKKFQDDPPMLAEKERSIQAFLNWLGVAVTDNGHLRYYPAQWKLAMVLAENFITSVACNISLPSAETIHFAPPASNSSIPLHDSYVIHHFDTVLAHPSMLEKEGKKSAGKGVLIPVSAQQIRQSAALRRAFANLIEGTVLRVPDELQDPQDEAGANFYFPPARWSLADALINDSSYNQASWNDELCLMSGRTSIIAPSSYSHEHEMAVTTLPGATLKVKYARYWGAIERMIEFVIEVRVLTQLVDSESYRFLGEITATIEKSRQGLTEGDIVLDKRLRKQFVQAANLRRIVALVQSLSRPQFWCRAEYAIRKAEYLLVQLGISQTLEHVEHNISSINSLVDHVDELYLADLSERGNDKSTLLSIGLAAASLTLTCLMLPSFWIDGVGLIEKLTTPELKAIVPLSTSTVVWATLIFGTGIGLGLICLAGILVFMAWQRRDLVLEMYKKLFNGYHEL